MDGSQARLELQHWHWPFSRGRGQWPSLGVAAVMEEGVVITMAAAITMEVAITTAATPGDTADSMGGMAVSAVEGTDTGTTIRATPLPSTDTEVRSMHRCTCTPTLITI